MSATPAARPNGDAANIAPLALRRDDGFDEVRRLIALSDAAPLDIVAEAAHRATLDLHEEASAFVVAAAAYGLPDGEQVQVDVAAAAQEVMDAAAALLRERHVDTLTTIESGARADVALWRMFRYGGPSSIAPGFGTAVAELLKAEPTLGAAAGRALLGVPDFSAITGLLTALPRLAPNATPTDPRLRRLHRTFSAGDWATEAGAPQDAVAALLDDLTFRGDRPWWDFWTKPILPVGEHQWLRVGDHRVLTRALVRRLMLALGEARSTRIRDDAVESWVNRMLSDALGKPAALAERVGWETPSANGELDGLLIYDGIRIVVQTKAGRVERDSLTSVPNEWKQNVLAAFKQHVAHVSAERGSTGGLRYPEGMHKHIDWNVASSETTPTLRLCVVADDLGGLVSDPALMGLGDLPANTWALSIADLWAVTSWLKGGDLVSFLVHRGRFTSVPGATRDELAMLGRFRSDQLRTTGATIAKSLPAAVVPHGFSDDTRGAKAFWDEVAQASDVPAPFVPRPRTAVTDLIETLNAQRPNGHAAAVALLDMVNSAGSPDATPATVRLNAAVAKVLNGEEPLGHPFAQSLPLALTVAYAVLRVSSARHTSAKDRGYLATLLDHMRMERGASIVILVGDDGVVAVQGDASAVLQAILATDPPSFALVDQDSSLPHES